MEETFQPITDEFMNCAKLTIYDLAKLSAGRVNLNTDQRARVATRAAMTVNPINRTDTTAFIANDVPANRSAGNTQPKSSNTASHSKHDTCAAKQRCNVDHLFI
jgi:hypothetical protein